MADEIGLVHSIDRKADRDLAVSPREVHDDHNHQDDTPEENPAAGLLPREGELDRKDATNLAPAADGIPEVTRFAGDTKRTGFALDSTKGNAHMITLIGMPRIKIRTEEDRAVGTGLPALEPQPPRPHPEQGQKDRTLPMFKVTI